MKKRILSGLFLLMSLCATAAFAQSNSSSEEELVTVLIKLRNVPEQKYVRIYDAQTSYYVEQEVSFRKIIDSVKIYLTSRGGIEVDSRAGTLIITDTVMNAGFMKDVVPAYDYKEIYSAEGEDRKVACCGFAGHC